MREDSALAEMLAGIELDSPIPSEAFLAVAEILSIVYHPLSAQGIAIRVYGVVFSFGVVFTELGW